MILAHALLKIDIREKLPRPLVGSPHRSPRRMPSSRESCPPPKRHRVLQQPARQVERSRDVPKKMYIDPQAAFAPKKCFDLQRQCKSALWSAAAVRKQVR